MATLNIHNPDTDESEHFMSSLDIHILKCNVNAPMDVVMKDANSNCVHRSPTPENDSTSLPLDTSLSDGSSLVFGAHSEGVRNLTSKRISAF